MRLFPLATSMLLLCAGAARGQTHVAPMGAMNDNTLPAHRHGVRIDPGDGHAPVLLYAVQQEGKDGRGLGMFRSDDEARSWKYLGPIQNDATHLDHADLVAVGRDVALVYSYEAYADELSTRHDVYFQWWRYDAAGFTWKPSAPVKVFDTGDSGQYYRAELARDSKGRLWVQAFLEDSSLQHRARIAVSTNEGAGWTIEPDLDTGLPDRGGGRLLSLGTRLIFLWDSHSANTRAFFRVRSDSDALDHWSAKTEAFPDGDNGIYHGAACSAVASGTGGMHLVYKDDSDIFYYRYFDGTRFSARTRLQDRGNWTVQPAITLHGRELVIFLLKLVSADTNVQLVVRTLKDGVFSAPVVLEDSVAYRAYPNALDVLPESVSRIPAWFCMGADVHHSGYLAQHIYTSSLGGGVPPPPDAGTPDAGMADAGTADAGMPATGSPDAGTADAATTPRDAGTPAPDAGSEDAGTPSPDAGTNSGSDAGVVERTVFEDHFPHTLPESPGTGWEMTEGLMKTDGVRMLVRRNVETVAQARPLFADGRVDAVVWPYGHTAGVMLRARRQAPQDRYDAVFVPSGNVQLRKVVGGAVTVLAEASPNLSSTNRTRMTLTAQGSGAVQLTLAINGTKLLSAVDAVPGVLASRGQAGVFGDYAGLGFDDFVAITTDGTDSDERFHDLFDRTAALGAPWSVASGRFDVNGQAVARGAGVALVAAPGDALAEAVVTPPASELALVARASSDGATSYEAALLSSGHVQVRRVRGGTVTVLADGPSGVSSAYATSPLTMGLGVTGAGSVTLSLWVNGAVVLTAVDGSADALPSTGADGLRGTTDGDAFDDFRLWPAIP